jgi:hypothetical protein
MSTVSLVFRLYTNLDHCYICTVKKKLISLSVHASPGMLEWAGCSNMFLRTHYNLTLTWMHTVHTFTPTFLKIRFNSILQFICIFPKWSPLFDL